MRVRAPYSLLLLSFFSLCTLPAFALPGEAAAVIQHCGAPQSDIQQPGDLDSDAERQLTYNDLTLHFQPENQGWSFTSAWRGNQSIDRTDLERSFPCFQAAIRQVAAGQPESPILYQTYQPTTSEPFGIPYFWLLLFLFLTILVVVFWGPRRSRSHIIPDDRAFRRPDLNNIDRMDGTHRV